MAGIAQAAGLRIGLVILPALALLAIGAVARHHATTADLSIVMNRLHSVRVNEPHAARLG